MPGYSNYFRSQCLNFTGAARLPIVHLYPPANVLAAAHDHDYAEMTWEDSFLKAISVTEIAESEIETLERKTRGQATNPQWFIERTKRITSSDFSPICKCLKEPGKFARSLTENKCFYSAATDHGRKYESHAVAAYEKDCDVVTKQCGIFASKDYPYLAASPDRIVDDQKILEVKCPYTSRNKFISHSTVLYLIDCNDGCLQLSPAYQYYYQIQGQLFCCNRSVCDLFVYTFVDKRIITVKRDEEFIRTMLLQLERFLNEHFRNAVLQKFFYLSL